MKYVINTLLLLLFSTALYAQNANDEVVIPEAMKKYCLYKFDTNKDGVISKQEAAQAKEFRLSDWEPKTDTLEGLEHFYNLESIAISNYQITNFDARPFKKLKTLSLYGNLRAVNLAENEMLEDLTLYSRHMETLDLHKNSTLQKLNLNLPSLNHIDLSKYPHLKELALIECKLTQINLSHNPELVKLDLSNNNLTTLNLTANKNLERLSLNTNSLTALNVSSNKKLDRLACRGNELSSLNVSENPLLTYLDCEQNKLTKLDLSKNGQLRTLYVKSNPLRFEDIKLGTVPGKELEIHIDVPEDQKITPEQAIEKLQDDLQKVDDAAFHLLVPYTNGRAWGLLDSRTRKPVVKPWLNDISFFNPNNYAYIYHAERIELYVQNGKLSFEAPSVIMDVSVMRAEEKKSVVKLISPDYGFKGFTVNEDGTLAAYSDLYYAQGVHHFNIIPFKYKGKYYAWATLKNADYQNVIIDEEGNYAPAFNGIYKRLERCFHVPAEEGRWFFVEDLEGNSYFQNMEGERKMENVFDVNPYRKGNSTFGYMIVPAGGQDGVFDLMKLEWKVEPQSSFAFNRLSYASKEDISRYSHLPNDRDKALIYILVKDKKNKMFYMDLEGNEYIAK